MAGFVSSYVGGLSSEFSRTAALLHENALAWVLMDGWTDFKDNIKIALVLYSSLFKDFFELVFVYAGKMVNCSLKRSHSLNC